MTRRSGTVLVAVLVIVMLSAMAAAVLLYRAQAEVTASTASGRSQQAYAAALDGTFAGDGDRGGCGRRSERVGG